MEKLLLRKVSERLITKMDLKQQVYTIFDRPRGGLSFERFKMTLRRKLGVPFSDQQLLLLFQKYDQSNSGAVSFDNFLHLLVPSDFGAGSRWQHGEEVTAHVSDTTRLKKHSEHSRSLPNLSDRQIMQEIQSKILRKGHKFSGQTGNTNSKDCYRHAYMLFGRPSGGITFDIFKAKLTQIGVMLPAEKWEAIFSQFDDVHGKLQFEKFIAALLPEDYPGNREAMQLSVSDQDKDWWKTKPEYLIRRLPLHKEKANVSLSFQNSPSRNLLRDTAHAEKASGLSIPSAELQRFKLDRAAAKLKAIQLPVVTRF